jgi:uncharacterized protein
VNNTNGRLNQYRIPSNHEVDQRATVGGLMKKVAPLSMVLDHDECVRLFASQCLGRLCVLEGEFPVAFPVNYRLMVEDSENVVFVIRTRADGILDQPGRNVSFQIDGVNPVTQRGWSVLARGVLHEDNSEGARQWLKLWNPRPWVGERDTWLYLSVTQFTGRRLESGEDEWAFEKGAYL